jgi:hypothetical protein
MAVDFPGGTSRVDVGNGSSLQITGAMAVMCWIRLDAASLNIDIISKYKSSPRGWTLQTDDDPPDDTWGIFLIAKNATQLVSSGWTASSLEPDTWYHLAGQYIPSTSVQVWLDGALSNEKTSGVPASMYDPANNVAFGNRPDGSQGLDGKMDDVRIYNRALSAGEMQTIHAAHGRDGILDGLVSRWLLHEGAPGTTLSGSNSVKDLTPNGNHGTPLGASTSYYESQLGWRR